VVTTTRPFAAGCRRGRALDERLTAGCGTDVPGAG
jgi:hypothetical protein